MFLQFTKFAFFCGCFISVQGMAVDLPTKALQDESHNVLNNMETAEGLQSTLTTASHTNITSSEIEGNTTLNETTKETTTLLNETIHTDIAPTSLQNVWIKISCEVVVSTLVLTISILLQDHVLSDVLSRQPHKILIVAGVVSLFSMVILIPAVLVFGQTSCVLFLVSFGLLAVHSRNSWNWSWHYRTAFTEFHELTRIAVYAIVAYLTCEIRDSTDIVLQLNLWIIIYSLAFSLNFFYMVDASLSYWEPIFRHLKSGTVLEDGCELVDDFKSVEVYRDANFRERSWDFYKDTIIIYLSLSAAYALCLCMKLTLFSILSILLEIFIVFAFWIMKKELSELLGKFKTHKTNCIEHPTEDIVNFGVSVLNFLPSKFGFKNLLYYQCKARNALADTRRKNQSAENYHRFQSTMCVLHHNEPYLYVIHLVMATAFIALLPYSSEYFI